MTELIPTKSTAKNLEAGEAILTSQQEIALPLLASGAKKKDAAAAAKVCPQTISAWLNEPCFCEALQSQRAKLAGLAADRLREMTDLAVDTIAALLKSESGAIRLKAATYVLDRVVVLRAGSATPESFDSQEDTATILAALGIHH